MSIFIKNIYKLIGIQNERALPLKGKEMSELESLDNAYMIIKGDIIADFGEMSEIDSIQLEAIENSVDKIIDAEGKMVFPSYCDSHTHLVYAGSREIEFMDKIKGLSYKEIAKRGGGILNSVDLLHNTSEDDLYKQTLVRAKEIMSLGTAAVEIKSGYGLSLEDEIKMLHVAKRIGEDTPLIVKNTFLGAHAVPRRYLNNREAYVNEIINEMIPVIASEELADFVDIFVEDGFFTVEDAERIFTAAMKYGLRPTVHANQMSCSGGIQVGVKYNAISVDHLEASGEEEIEVLKNSETIATMLPGATFFMEMDYAPARKYIDAGVPLAIATNYNPGSCPSGDMKFMMTLACLKMKLTPEEVINASTINGAFAMDVQNEVGSITRGKKANIFITKKIPSYEYLPYAFSSNLIDLMILKGKLLN